MLHTASSDHPKVDIESLLRIDHIEHTPPPSDSGLEAAQVSSARSHSVPAPNAQQSPIPPRSLHRATMSEAAAIPTHAILSNRLPELTNQSPYLARGSSAAPPQCPILPPLQISSGLQQGHPASQYNALGAPFQQQPPPVLVRVPSPQQIPGKRAAPTSVPTGPPAKRQSKWTPDEDSLIIELRGSGMKWEEISKRLPGRSAISCRLHYQNYLERRSEWDEERKNRLARLYERQV